MGFRCRVSEANPLPSNRNQEIVTTFDPDLTTESPSTISH
jgi:hypothetical protein